MNKPRTKILLLIQYVFQSKSQVHYYSLKAFNLKFGSGQVLSQKLFCNSCRSSEVSEKAEKANIPSSKDNRKIYFW